MVNDNEAHRHCRTLADCQRVIRTRHADRVKDRATLCR